MKKDNTCIKCGEPCIKDDLYCEECEKNSDLYDPWICSNCDTRNEDVVCSVCGADKYTPNSFRTSKYQSCF
jgi:predicted amidophosphoribosyltransferase